MRERGKGGVTSGTGCGINGRGVVGSGSGGSGGRGRRSGGGRRGRFAGARGGKLLWIGTSGKKGWGEERIGVGERETRDS